MKEYQAVVLPVTRHPREDEEALTDLLNERSRAGWTLVTLTHDAHRMTAVFQRDAVPDA
jgi:ABC-type Mn2+/Zn2+ transport system ATPase subunit